MIIGTEQYEGAAADLVSRVCERCLTIVRVGDWWQCPHEPIGNFTVRDDSIPGGMIVDNLGPQPQKFYSKSEWHRAMDKAGLQLKVRHVPKPGSDKSPHTQRWV